MALPGEALPIKIVKQGDQIGQGVGYLDDGTMVVVEQGRSAIGQEVSITVTHPDPRFQLTIPPGYQPAPLTPSAAYCYRRQDGKALAVTVSV